MLLVVDETILNTLIIHVQLYMPFRSWKDLSPIAYCFLPPFASDNVFKNWCIFFQIRQFLYHFLLHSFLMNQFFNSQIRVRTKAAKFEDLCQTAQEECQKFNSDVMEGTTEKRIKVEENPSEVKKGSPDVILTVESLCSILKQQCGSTDDTSSGVKRMSLRSLWQRD